MDWRKEQKTVVNKFLSSRYLNHLNEVCVHVYSCVPMLCQATLFETKWYLHICTSKPIKRKQWWRNTQKHSIKLPNLNIGLPWQQNSKKKNLLLHIKLLKKCPWWKQHGILNTEKEYRESSPRRRQSLRVNLLISSFTKKKWLKPSPNIPPFPPFF